MRHTFPVLAIGSAIALAFTATAHGMGPGGHPMGPGNHPGMGHQPRRTILAFNSMYGVDGPFVGDANPVRGVVGDESPWEVKRALGSLDSEGNLLILIRGLVFKDNPDPTLIGKNDEPTFRGLVSCLTEQGTSVTEANVETAGFPATPNGDSFIHVKVTLPNPCVAPIIMVLAGSEEKWFSMTGFEAEGN